MKPSKMRARVCGLLMRLTPKRKCSKQRLRPGRQMTCTTISDTPHREELLLVSHFREKLPAENRSSHDDACQKFGSKRQCHTHTMSPLLLPPPVASLNIWAAQSVTSSSTAAVDFRFRLKNPSLIKCIHTLVCTPNLV